MRLDNLSLGSETLSDGERDYTFYEGGLAVIQALPPSGFDAVSATDAELDRYGYPPRPSETDTTDYGAWETAIAAMPADTPPTFDAIQPSDQTAMICLDRG